MEFLLVKGVKWQDDRDLAMIEQISEGCNPRVCELKAF